MNELMNQGDGMGWHSVAFYGIKRFCPGRILHCFGASIKEKKTRYMVGHPATLPLPSPQYCSFLLLLHTSTPYLSNGALQDKNKKEKKNPCASHFNFSPAQRFV
jgi:hypothetical protein